MRVLVAGATGVAEYAPIMAALCKMERRFAPAGGPVPRFGHPARPGSAERA